MLATALGLHRLPIHSSNWPSCLCNLRLWRAGKESRAVCTPSDTLLYSRQIRTAVTMDFHLWNLNKSISKYHYSAKLACGACLVLLAMGIWPEASRYKGKAGWGWKACFRFVWVYSRGSPRHLVHVFSPHPTQVKGAVPPLLYRACTHSSAMFSEQMVCPHNSWFWISNSRMTQMAFLERCFLASDDSVYFHESFYFTLFLCYKNNYFLCSLYKQKENIIISHLIFT